MKLQLIESPDRVYNNKLDIDVGYSDTDAYTFGYYNNKFYISDRSIHYLLLLQALNNGLKNFHIYKLTKPTKVLNKNHEEVVLQKNSIVLINYRGTKLYNLKGEEFFSTVIGPTVMVKLGSQLHNLNMNFFKYLPIKQIFERDLFKLPGRLWTRKQVISFWTNPTKPELSKLIKDIKSKIMTIDIDDNWLIEYDEGKLKRIGDYLGHVRKDTDMTLQHAISPILKQKRKVDGFGSDKYNKLASKLKYNSVAQMNYHNKNRYYEDLNLTNILKK